MKNSFCCLLILFSTGLFAQPAFNSADRKHSIKSAYGYRNDANWWEKVFKTYPIDRPGHTDDLWFKYELYINKKLSVGIETGISWMDKGNELFSTSSYSAKADAWRLLPTASYYFYAGKRLSCYTSFSAGFYSLKYKVVQSYPSDRNWMGGPFPFTEYRMIADRKETGFDWAASAGMQVTFSNTVGGFAEWGINKSVFLTGIAVKFQNKKIKLHK